MTSTRFRIQPGELLVSIALAALGAYVVLGAQAIGGSSGYSQVGPRAFPYLIGSGLLLLGGILSWQAVSGGWRNMPERNQDGAPDWPAFAILSGAILLHMVSIAWAGFILASTFLFLLIARGLGSRRIGRDLLIGALLSSAAYFVFTRGLSVRLPAGLLGV